MVKGCIQTIHTAKRCAVPSHILYCTYQYCLVALPTSYSDAICVDGANIDGPHTYGSLATASKKKKTHDNNLHVYAPCHHHDVTSISLESALLQTEPVHLTNVMGLPRGHCTFLPFPSALTSLCTPSVAQAWSRGWTYLLNERDRMEQDNRHM